MRLVSLPSVVLFSFFSGLAACGARGGLASDTVIHARDYDQSCTVAADCVPIVEGSACAECPCWNAAINASQLPAEVEAAEGASASCPSEPMVWCGACSEAYAICQGGRCALVTCSGSCPTDAGTD
jgi:hypothetical protein